MKLTNPPTWFSTSIREGLARTYTLSLDGSPAAEMVGATTATWIDDLWHDRRYAWADEGVDPARIAAAFRTIRQTARRWPGLDEFHRALPPPPERAALKHQPCTPEQAAANLKRLNALVGEVFGSQP